MRVTDNGTVRGDGFVYNMMGGEVCAVKQTQEDEAIAIMLLLGTLPPPSARGE